MKNLNRILVISFLFCSVFSCTKNKEITINKGNISAKWLVSETSSDYESFEFNESGNYIVVKNTTQKSTNNQNVYFGTYKIIDNSSIELSDFGTLKITSIDDNNISFSLTLEGYPKIDIIINATKADKIATSSKTELLCRTWNLVSLNGVSAIDTEYDLTVLFSDAGTYFVTFNDSLEDLSVAQWCWKSNSETTLCYSWEGEPTCDGESEVEILKLTESELQISENMGDETWIYGLEPATGSKSKLINSGKSIFEKPFHSGFFKK
jgi:hypothetical protein